MSHDTAVWLAVRAGLVFIGAAVGGALGSFLGLAFDRLPRGGSILEPPSRCGGCERTLAAWENVPVLAWVAFRGRCRTCGAAIGWQTVVLESALAAVGGYIVWWQTGFA